MRAPWPLLALLLVLAACVDLDFSDDSGSTGNPGAGVDIGVLTRPATTPRPGDTLTFFAVFKDSTSDKYAIRWDLDRRGQRILSGCPRGVCAKWIVPPGSGDYRHYIEVSSSKGLSSFPFKTDVP